MGFTSGKFKSLAYNFRIGLGSLLVLLLFSAYLSIKSQVDNNESTETLECSNSALFELESIDATLNDAESAQRGYELTKKPSFLAPFYGAYRKTLIKLYHLKSLFKDDGIQQNRLARLNELIRERFVLLYKNIYTGNTQENLNHENILKSKLRIVIGSMKNMENRKQKELVQRSADSKERMVFLNILFSILGLGTAVVFFVKNTQEIVKRSRTEVQLKLKNHRLQQYTAELEQIAYISAHDLKEPLRAIGCYSELIVKSAKDDKDQMKMDEYSEVLIKKVRSMSSIIDALSEFSRISNDPAYFVKINCEETLEKIKKNYADEIWKTNTVIKADVLPSVKGIPVQVEQVFEHLIDNAIKFRRPGQNPVIDIRVSETDQMWQFSFRDNGIGIDSKYSHKLFKVFNRLHNRDQYSGNGIGLAKCKKIIESHEGRIWYEPSETQGAVFNFTLPKADFNV